MKTLNLAPTANGLQHMRRLFAESIRGHTDAIRDLDALTERLEVVWESNGLHAFTFDHGELDFLLEALHSLRGTKSESIGALQGSIDEIDRVNRINADIREAGY